MGSMANGERDGSTGPRDATGLDACGDRVGLLRGSMANGERDGSTGPRDATGLDAYGDRVGLLRGSMANGERDGSTGPRDAWVSMHTEIGSACYGEAWQRRTGREYGTSGCNGSRCIRRSGRLATGKHGLRRTGREYG